MTEASPTATSFLDRNHFLLRRLHSLTGIVPIGVFLIAHLLTNSSVLWGAITVGDKFPDASLADRGIYYFQKEVSWINEQIPHLFIIEVTLWVSIAFHSILGLVYARTGRSNVSRYAYQDNWRYTLQRWSGYIGIFFIFYHVATLRWKWDFLVPGGTKWSHDFASSTLAAALQGSPDGYTLPGILISIFYFVGITLLVFHFANGLWTAAITWGLTISESAQRRWGVACAGLGAALMVMAWASLFTFFLMDHDRAREVEQRMLKSPPLETVGVPDPAILSETAANPSRPNAHR